MGLLRKREGEDQSDCHRTGDRISGDVLGQQVPIAQAHAPLLVHAHLAGCGAVEGGEGDAENEGGAAEDSEAGRQASAPAR